MTIDRLQQRLRKILPGARLEPVSLDAPRALDLWLLNADYPQGELTAEQAARVMDNPLYWVFCWASGQVLARWLLEHPDWVRGRRVLDFGCGSGVVAIAAALAGADEVLACDIDPDALDATAANAALNGVELELVADFADVTGPVDLLIAADVLYDRANLGWLERFRQRADRVLLADSRVKDFSEPGYRQLAARESCTLPDLDESVTFRDVRIYLGSGASLPRAR
ncbi:class I SAM-dependent methyltransferase [Haliea atlantica]